VTACPSRTEDSGDLKSGGTRVRTQLQPLPSPPKAYLLTMPQYTPGSGPTIGRRKPKIFQRWPDLTLANFLMDERMSSAGLNETEQKIVHLFRCMIKFHDRNGPLLHLNEGREKVHSCFIKTTAERYKQRDLTTDLLRILVSILK
jgi:hypothetical protein